MADNFFTSLFALLIASAQSGSNAFGEKGGAGRLAALIPLLPKFLDLVGQFSHAKDDLKEITGEKLSGFFKQFADEVDLPGEKADEIIDSLVPVAQSVGQLIDVGQSAAKSIKSLDLPHDKVSALLPSES